MMLLHRKRLAARLLVRRHVVPAASEELVKTKVANVREVPAAERLLGAGKSGKTADRARPGLGAAQGAMRFNSTQLTALSRGPPGSFDIEGRLVVHREPSSSSQKPQDSKERWCRLKGNLLFLMKKSTEVSVPFFCLAV
ncbi:type II inositol 3,4-bisphosphate 4-phosphatase isoform X1 [Arapaima gigas]